MRFLAGLSAAGSFEAGKLVGFLTNLEMNRIPFQLVEAAGSLYLGVGQPDECSGEHVSAEHGPLFLSSGFLVGESLVQRSYPLVLVAGRDRLEVEIYESEPGLADAMGIPALTQFTSFTGRGPLVAGDRYHDSEATADRIRLAKLAIEQGQLAKIVVSGRARQALSPSFSVGKALSRLKKAHPESHLYYVDGFFGASPELVAAKSGNLLSLRPLAGTALRGGQVALLNSAKDLGEHRLMVDQLSDDLQEYVKELEMPRTPVLFDAGRLIHLATPMRAQLLPGVSLTSILAAIAPTAAVSGVPRESAFEMLRVMEPYRGHYAGIAGIIDPFGDGEIYLMIRGARQFGDELEMVAGAGIVADSRVEAEITEIEAKFDVVTRPLASR